MEETSKIIEIIPQNIFSWFFTDGFKIVIIVLGFYILQRALKTFSERLIRKIIVEDLSLSKDAEEKREETLIKISNNTISIATLSMAAMIVLQTLGIPVGPILAAAGVAGLALGFGGQYLIRDVINGLFLILENQYRVGDVICSGSTCGLVEDISLRMTTLRDMDGVVHHIPHGEIKIVSNMTKNFSRVNLNIGIGYNSDMEKVANLINGIGEKMKQEKYWSELLMTPPKFLRINSFGDSAIEIKITGDTAPGKQYEVTGELRYRLKVAFDKEGIEIPFPQRVVHQAK